MTGYRPPRTPTVASSWTLVRPMARPNRLPVTMWMSITQPSYPGGSMMHSIPHFALVPRDVDVCFRLDMDERPRSGWRQAIETEFDADTTMLRYPYNWSRQINFYCDRVHRRQGYRWRGATHEGLIWRGDGPERQKFIHSMTVDHFQKPKNRPNDLRLLQEAVSENPRDAQLRLYYARELVWKNALEASNELKEFQSLSKVDCDLAYSYRLLAKVDPLNQLAHLETAERLDPSASVYLDLADYWYDKQDWSRCHHSIQTCLSKFQAIGNWTDDLRLRTCYPHDIACVAAWNIGAIDVALMQAQKAIDLNPSDPRLQTNLEHIKARKFNSQS